MKNKLIWWSLILILILSFRVPDSFDDYDTLYIYLKNKGEIPVHVALYSDGGLRTRYVSGWKTINPEFSLLKGGNLIYEGSRNRDIHLAFYIEDSNGRRGIVQYHSQDGVKSDAAFCIPKNKLSFENSGSDQDIRTCGPDEVLVPFTWEVDIESENDYSAQEDEIITILVYPKASDPICMYLDDGPSPHLKIYDYLKNCSNKQSFKHAIDSKGLKTSILVKEGDVIEMKATGYITLGVFAGSSSPIGIKDFTIYNRVKGFNHGALLFRVGNSTWQSVDENLFFKADRTGILEFLVNDIEPQNNSGSYQTEITHYKF